jgi:hypothetical protein
MIIRLATPLPSPPLAQASRRDGRDVEHGLRDRLAADRGPVLVHREVVDGGEGERAQHAGEKELRVRVPDQPRVGGIHVHPEQHGRVQEPESVQQAQGAPGELGGEGLGAGQGHQGWAVEGWGYREDKFPAEARRRAEGAEKKRAV